MNVLTGILLLISSIYFSYLLSDKFVKRKNFYADFFEFNNKITNEVFFNQETLSKIAKEFKAKTLEFSRIISNYDHLNLKSVNYLSDEEKDYIEKYINNLGMSDKNSQLNFLEQVRLYLDDKQKICTEELKKNKNLYIKMGILLGVILMVICL